MEKIGDLGKVAAKFKLVQKAFFVGRMVNKLSVQQVFEQLRQIAQISGEAVIPLLAHTHSHVQGLTLLSIRACNGK